MKVTFLLGHLVKERDLILNELAEDLGKYGAQVTVISGFPSRRISENTIKYYHEHPIEKISNNVLSIRVGSKKGEGNNLFCRMIRYISLCNDIVNEALRYDVDVYYIYSTPPFLGYYINRLKKKAPVLYNAQDLFPDSLVKALSLSENNVLIKILRHLEKNVYKNSDAIVTISEDMKKRLIFLGADSDKIKVINNWADNKKIKPILKKNNKLYEEFSIPNDKFTVLYAGDIGLHQRLELFIDVANKLKEFTDIQFVFFGNGAYVKEMKNKIKKYALKRFHMFPLQPIERISEVYSLGDIDIVSLETGMTNIALPSKIWTIMLTGKPILGLLDKDSHIANIINNNYGYIIDGLSVEEICNTILYCKNNQNKLQEMGCRSRVFALEQSAKDIQTKKYYEELLSLTKKINDIKLEV